MCVQQNDAEIESKSSQHYYLWISVSTRDYDYYIYYMGRSQSPCFGAKFPSLSFHFGPVLSTLVNSSLC